MKKVVVLAGPTASGKTSLSIEIAKKLNMEIINGDSVAVYKKLDIGSAKINRDEMLGVQHHLLDIKEPMTEYSVYDYQQDVRKLIDQIDRPLIVGGSGFYIKSALYNYQFIESDEISTSDISVSKMVEKIKQNDPTFEFDENNIRRIQSAYRQVMNLEKPSQKINKNVPLYDILILYLDMPRDLQEDLITKRLDKMLSMGFIEENKSLRDQGIIIRDIIGYRELNLYEDGIISLDEAKQKIIKVSFQFSKRQKTWFLNQMNPILLNPLSPTVVADTIKIIEDFLS